jgi:PilZ domain
MAVCEYSSRGISLDHGYLAWLRSGLARGNASALAARSAPLYRSLRIVDYQSIMETRASPRKTVLMSGAIEFAGSTKNCLIQNMSISGAALDVTDPLDIPERFDLVFRADGTRIPCHVIWRQEDRIGVAFD